MVETLQLDILKESGEEVDFSLIQGMDISLDGRTYVVGFNSVSVNKKMGKVNAIYLEFCISDRNGKPYFPRMGGVAELLTRRKVVLKLDDEVIAKDYIVFKVTPKKFRHDATSKRLDRMNVTLEIVSPDKYLSLKSFCRAYTAKRFYKDIVIPELESGFYIANITSDGKGLRFLGCDDNELIQPYLVQYNESFRDFILRTMNRCGEFFYFEDGILHFGLEKKGADINGSEEKPIELKNYSSLIYQESALEHNGLSFTADDLGGHDANSFMIDAPGNAKWTYVDETGEDEYLHSIKKDSYDSQRGEMSVSRSEFSQFLELFVQHKNYSQLVADFAKYLLKSETAAAMKSSNENSNFNSKYFDKNKFDSAQFDSAESPENLSQFGTYTEDGEWMSNIHARFYSFIRNLQNSLEYGKIKVEYDNNIQFLKLGDIVSHNKEKFVVTDIEIKQTYDNLKWNGSLVAELTPMAIVTYDDVTYQNWVAPKADIIDSRTVSGGQMAIVADAKDPERLARVRVKFKWQTEDDKNLSPWIKTRTMASTPNGGILFMPRVGDEIMVGFISGNIERPYMMGGVYTEQSGPRGGTRKYDNMISSPNGHSIRFNTVNRSTMGANFFRALQPVSWLLASPATLFDKITDEESSRFPLMGGIEIGDDNGLCSIYMSSDERKVSIISNFGNVDISAYTGIKVSAPNGDIKITGRNVNITAGNNITLESGTNCDLASVKPSSKSDFAKAYAKEGLSHTLTDITSQFCDLSLIRTVIETLVKPVEGTLKIKSHKYMMIEAGLGTAEVPDGDYLVGAKKMNLSFTNSTISATLRAISTNVQKNIKTHIDRYNSLCRQVAEINVLFAKAGIPGNIATDEIKSNEVLNIDAFKGKIGEAIADANKAKLESWVRTINQLKKFRERALKVKIEVDINSKGYALKESYFETAGLTTFIKDWIHVDNVNFQPVNNAVPVDEMTKLKRKVLVAVFNANRDTVTYTGKDSEPWTDPDRWRNYILDLKITNSSKTKELLEYVGNKLLNVARTNILERDLWNKTGNSSLLISEKEKETFRLEHGELSRYRNIDYQWISDCLNFE